MDKERKKKKQMDSFHMKLPLIYKTSVILQAKSWPILTRTHTRAHTLKQPPPTHTHAYQL